ncbi:metalloprotease [Coprinopsis cinerea okayama7|uniref:Metalloprotease n=1 Tax=Coprinopsis cinerea (strain Okayama-7 / 130 / ATCC MYA-4618 / FGSC 9003) TaxID=240176 RepID=A8PI60_COPC7|nr:metalloprotease [Coprinopsis cinerea okayama7\|eukprot:XP_001841521.2 metalloprotease [Coprinopsis cinerea okayama7\
MRLSLMLTSALTVIASVASAQRIGNRRRTCGSELTDAQVASAQEAHGNVTLQGFADMGIQSYTPRVINVWFHVVRSGTTYAQGDVASSQITNQISALNSAFSGTDLSFTLAGTTRTTNANWFTGAKKYNWLEYQMMSALKVGGADTLNIYSTDLVTAGPNLLGYASFPWDYSIEPQMDGVVIHWDTVPGGGFAPYNLGMTLVHEVGHWLGLLHTFQGTGCSPTGDEVPDTPTENGPAFGCPIGRDTCPGAGVDPIRESMSFTEDMSKR